MSSHQKIYYINAKDQFCITLVLLFLRPIIDLRKNSKHCTKLVCCFQIVLIRQISVFNRSKIYCSDARHQFCTKTLLISLKILLHLRKIPNGKPSKLIFPWEITVNLSISYRNLSIIRSKVCYSNTTYQFCMTSVLLSLKPIWDLRKNSKHSTKLVSLW